MKELPLTKGYTTAVDDEDFERLSAWKWFYCSGYAARWEKGTPRKRILLHKFLKEGLIIDHIDGNPLNNSKQNLRSCSHVQNCMNKKMLKNNTTGYKGVWFNKSSGKYVAEIYVNKIRIFLGEYSTPEIAGDAYKKAAIIHHGEFRRV